MNSLLSYILLFAIVCYSAFGFQPEIKANAQTTMVEICSIENQSEDSCCHNLNTTNETEEVCSHDNPSDNCEKPCCEDYCSCIKIIKNVFLEPTRDSEIKTSTIKRYGELNNSATKRFTPSIFTPPKKIA